MEVAVMTFGEKIKLERTKRGMDQKEFAKLIQVSTRMISVYENGKSFPRTRADYARIAETLGVSVDYLLTENEEFIMNIGSEFGPRGAKGAQKILDQINYTYTNGEIDEDDLEILTQGIQEIYWKVRQKNREKYDPYKNKRGKDSGTDTNTDSES